MTTRAWRRSHFVAGVLGLLIGAFVIWEAWDYPMGSVTRMGPGYFPFLLGIVMVAVSLGVILFEGRLSVGEDIPAPAYLGLVWISLAVAAFATLAERLGMVPAIFAAVILSAQADSDLGLREIGALAAGTSVVCTVLFIYILGLPLVPVRF